MSGAQYSLTEDQQALRQATRAFAHGVLFAAAAETEKTQAEFPSEMLLAMARQGLLGLDVPPEYGGQGFDTLTCAVILEEIAACWFSATIYAMNLATGPLLAAGSSEQKRHYLPEICAGRMVPAFGLTEPAGGSDAASIKTAACRDGSDYLLRGHKIFITNAHRAGVLIVFAKTDPDAPRGQGVSIFLVERAAPGLVIGQRFNTLGHAANPIWEVVFDDCRIPKEALLGREGEGFSYLQRDFAKIRATYGSRCVGVAQGALDYALQYAVERRQFGEPVASFQGIRFKVAELMAKIEAARQLSYRAAVVAEAMSPDAPVAASMAKLFASQVAVETTGEAIQLMGGHGLVTEHPLERYYREAKLFQIGDGTSEMLRLLISRHGNRMAGERQSAQIG
ncbi:MAG TPA: acyl-CoA dehydrogenase family protein [Xanthobacteraceae bacterium]